MENSKFKPDYFKVAYSIRTPSYYRPEDSGLGFRSEAESTAFHADCERIFRNGGWEIEHGYAVNGKSSLYLHPQQFLGTIHEELVDAVPELIAQATLFQFQQNGKARTTGNTMIYRVERICAATNVVGTKGESPICFGA